MAERGFPIPDSEPARQAALEKYAILDTLPEQAYDNLVGIAAIICDSPIALITLLDGDRQWFKARVGLSVSETPRDQAFCSYAVLEPDEVMVVRDAMADARFVDNPLVTGDPGIRFYAGAPLVTAEGYALGTMCVIDRTPRDLSERQLEALRMLASEVVTHLELRKSVADLERTVLEQDAFMEHLQEYQRELEAQGESLRNQSTTDPLTGLANRRALDAELEAGIARATRYGSKFSILMIDIDHFKGINDSFGHPAGDQTLQDVAAVLQAELRAPDSLCRFGGEEFVALLPNTGPVGARVMAERLRRAVEAATWHLRPMTVSIGVASATNATPDSATLLREGDAALYVAKQAGRNRVAGPFSGAEPTDG